MVHPNANNDADTLCEAVAHLTLVSVELLVIGNRVIMTHELQWVSHVATSVLEQRMSWCVRWKPNDI